MYTNYFGFRENPFSSTSDPRFFYTNPSYQEAYANLLYGIQQRKGFTVLTGEIGTGKTTLLRRVMDHLGPSVHFVFVHHSRLNFEELLILVCEELGLQARGSGRLKTIQTLNDFLIAQGEKKKIVALLIDEAQDLQEEVFENLRLVSNLETFSHKLLQIVLVGQPELDTKLDLPELRQFKQRVAVRYRLNRLADQEIASFISFRLQAVGCSRRTLFAPEALRRLAVYSHGLPRQINIICDNALLIAYGASQKTVAAWMIEEVARDLRLSAAGYEAKLPLLEANSPSKNGTIKTRQRRKGEPLQLRPRRLSWAAVLLVVCLLGSLALLQSQADFTLPDSQSARLQPNTHQRPRAPNFRNNGPEKQPRASHPSLRVQQVAPPAKQKEVEKAKPQLHPSTVLPHSTQDQSVAVLLSSVKEQEKERAESKRQLEEEQQKGKAARGKLAQMGIPYQREVFIQRVKAGDRRAVDLFLAAGMSPNAQEKDDWIPLAVAASAGHVPIVHRLLAHGAALNAKTGRGLTPLIVATWTGHVPIVRELLARGAAVNATDKSGRTALSYAEEEQHEELMVVLKRAGGKK